MPDKKKVKANTKGQGVKKTPNKQRQTSISKKKESKPEGKTKDIIKTKKSDEKRIVYARSKYIQMSARKVRLVIDLIRDMNAIDALDKIQYVYKSASLPVRKAIKSAVSNAVNNFEMEEKNLVIVKAFVDDAPLFKRGRAGSRGRYKKILKRNCHITIGVQEK